MPEIIYGIVKQTEKSHTYIFVQSTKDTKDMKDMKDTKDAEDTQEKCYILHFSSKKVRNHLQITRNILTLQKKLRLWESILTLGPI